MNELRLIDRRAYFVCATQRSGSTLLCELLKATGVAGRPGEFFEQLRSTGMPRQGRQYFEGIADQAAIGHLPPVDPGRPEQPGEFERLIRGIVASQSSANGVFAAKLMWNYMDDFRARLRLLPGLADAPAGTAIRSVFSDPQFIYVTREDKVAQAVSLWKAIQTQQWRDEGGVGKSPRAIYSFAALDHLVCELEAWELEWERWFEQSGVDPIRVVYERLSASRVETIERVLLELGLEVPERDLTVSPLMRRQADESSEEWARRYLDESTATVIDA
ncbi:MAG: Stf0 family sulfotransferase [Solirubrobacterales bacterium]